MCVYSIDVVGVGGVGGGEGGVGGVKSKEMFGVCHGMLYRKCTCVYYRK
jgi:hypothetical protein